MEKRPKVIQEIKNSGALRNLVISVGGSALLSFLLIAVRYWYTDRLIYAFLVWNLFLAWIPLGFALLASRWKIARISQLVFLILFLLWLLFFPNAPYLVTDLIHLKSRNNVPLWFDAVILFFFAWQGLLLSFASLSLMQNELRRRFGLAWARASVLPILVLTGMGIYIGRFLRWNSWDIVSEPGVIFNDFFQIFEPPYRLAHTLAFTLLFSAFLIVAYGAFRYLVRFLAEEDSRD